MTATVVCTLGMHRSGTSVVSRLLNLLGVHLGPDTSLMPPKPDNPKGFWEHESFVVINEEILARFGGAWDRPPALPQDWERDARLDDLRARARRLIASDFLAAPLWGWKDPRCCLTLPFWRDLVGPLHCVLVLRNPSDVAASLASRNGIGVEQAARLWLSHVEGSFRHAAGSPRLLLFYEDVVADAPGTLKRLAAFLGRPEPAKTARVKSAARAFVEADLRHHRATRHDLASDAAVSFAAKSLYLALASLAHAAEPPDARATTGDGYGPLQALASQALAEQESRDDLSGRYRALEGTAAELAALRAEHDRAVAAGVEMAAERDRLVDQRDTIAADLERVTAAHQRMTVDRHALAARLAQVTAERDHSEAERQRATAEWQRTAAERDRIRLEHDDAASDRDQARRELHRLRARVNGLVTKVALTEHERNILRAERDSLHDERDSLRAERDGVRGERDLAERTLAEIRGSAAWTLISRGRQLIVRTLPKDTRRRRALDALLARLRP